MEIYRLYNFFLCALHGRLDDFFLTFGCEVVYRFFCWHDRILGLLFLYCVGLRV
jgi:hypothetical protein